MLTEQKKEEINNVIHALQRQYPELTVPAFDITSFLITNESFSIATMYIDDDTTGMLIVDDDNHIQNTTTHRLIIINGMLQEKPDYIQRRRFITAHEYGHFSLHKKESKQYAHRDTQSKEKPEEIEAEYFARCLLMPEKTIKELLNLKTIQELGLREKINTVARMFNVTTSKAQQRLQNDFGFSF